MFEKITFNPSKKVLAILGVIFAIGFGYLGLKYYLLLKESKKVEISEAELKENVKMLEEEQLKIQEENRNLSDLLEAEKRRNDELNSQVDKISRTVGTLQKLSETDKELLQKYSKVYFLNENYIPSNLSSIGEKYLYEKDRDAKIHAKVQKFLYRLMDDAEKNGAPLLIVSAYRSFGEQATLKTGYTTSYGTGANKFSADQGYSEHQLGTAVDFTSTKLNASFTKFDTDDAYEWLLKNAYKYGFVLSYPKGNGYYQFEPWHWRFVGVALASNLHDWGIYFYDMPQREIDTYLTDIFD